MIFERSNYTEANLEVFHRGGEGLDTSRAFLFERMVDDHASLTSKSDKKSAQSDTSDTKSAQSERQRALATSMRAMILALHRSLIRKENTKISDRYKEYARSYPPFYIILYLLRSCIISYEPPLRSRRTLSALTAAFVALGFLAVLLLAQLGGFVTLGRPPNEPNITNIRIEVRKVLCF